MIRSHGIEAMKAMTLDQWALEIAGDMFRVSFTVS
jgi:hypothetical protein